MRLSALAAIGGALGLASVPASAARPAVHPAAPHAAAQDWSKVVFATKDGGMRLGNPDAKVKLVEYGSLACPHCRHFEETGYGPLVRNYVRGGKVSYEFRNVMLNAADVAVTLLTRCSGGRYFAMAEAVYSAQPDWEKRLAAMSDADRAAVAKMADHQVLIRYAEVTRLVPVAAKFGVTPARARQCLTDDKTLQRLIAVEQAGNDQGVSHTPTFFIDGKMSDAASWEELEPQLKSALGG